LAASVVAFFNWRSTTSKMIAAARDLKFFIFFLLLKIRDLKLESWNNPRKENVETMNQGTQWRYYLGLVAAARDLVARVSKICLHTHVWAWLIAKTLVLIPYINEWILFFCFVFYSNLSIISNSFVWYKEKN